MIWNKCLRNVYLDISRTIKCILNGGQMKKYLSKVIMTFLIYLIGSLLFEQYNSFLIAYFSGVLTMGMSFIIEILQ